MMFLIKNTSFSKTVGTRVNPGRVATMCTLQTFIKTYGEHLIRSVALLKGSKRTVSNKGIDTIEVTAVAKGRALGGNALPLKYKKLR